MSLTAGFVIQPSSDAKATAISVAWILANRIEVKETDSEKAAKRRAELIGELAGKILEGTASYA